MASRATSRISHRRAAELMYRTTRPTTQQVERVTELIATGELSGDSRGTNAQAVADFVSRAAMKRQEDSNRQSGRSRLQRDSQRAKEVYQESLRDYFLAVFMRRKVHNASRMFRRAVLGGQIAFLVGLLVVILFGVRMMFPPLSPERAAAVSWLEENTERYRIIKFHPTTVDETGKSRLWVEYHYTTPQGRGIDTRRIFTVVENRVIAVDSEE